RPSRMPSLSGLTEPTAKTSWMPTSSFQSTRLNRAPINGLKNTTPIGSMRHLDIKPRQPMQHKGFLRHTPSGMLLKKKGDEQLTALQTTFRRENLSLAGCSSAEPASVSVQQYKIQISKLYLQPVEIPSHFHLSQLRYKGYSDHGRDYHIYEAFDLQEFFNSFGDSQFHTAPKHYADEVLDDEYTPEFQEISLAYRQAKNWTCEECKMTFANDKAALHTHHVNGIRSDNRRTNLRALCVRCHAEQPGHERMKGECNCHAVMGKYQFQSSAR